MRNIILSTAVLSLFAVPAMAQTSPSSPTYYGTIGYSQLDGSQGDLGAVTGRLGAQFTPHLGVEGEVSFGVRDDDFTVAGVNGTIEHQYDVALYGVATLPLSPGFELFARAGYGKTELKAKIAGFSDTADGESWNYGAGANFFLDYQNGIRADWTRRDFTGSNAGEADVYSVSYIRRF